MAKANKKSIEHKYRETQQVDIEDVRAMINDYENKISVIQNSGVMLHIHNRTLVTLYAYFVNDLTHFLKTH